MDSSFEAIASTLLLFLFLQPQPLGCLFLSLQLQPNRHGCSCSHFKPESCIHIGCAPACCMSSPLPVANHCRSTPRYLSATRGTGERQAYHAIPLSTRHHRRPTVADQRLKNHTGDVRQDAPFDRRSRALPELPCACQCRCGASRPCGGWHRLRMATCPSDFLKLPRMMNPEWFAQIRTRLISVGAKQKVVLNSFTADVYRYIINSKS